MFKFKSSNDATLDVDLADKFLAINKYEDQRNIKPANLSDLQSKLQDGRYTVAHIAVAICKYNSDEQVLVNGQHSCTAVKTTLASVPAIVEYYECESKDDLALLYSQFDSVLSSRTTNDIARTALNRLSVSWHERTVQLMVQALAFVQNGSKFRNMSRDQKVFLLERSHIPAGNFIEKLFFGAVKGQPSPRHMMSIPIVAAMLETYAKNPADAVKFWTSVRDGDSLVVDSPEFKLREYLKTGSYAKNKRFGTNSLLIREAYVKARHAWNAYRSGTRTNLKYYKETSVPSLV